MNFKFIAVAFLLATSIGVQASPEQPTEGNNVFDPRQSTVEVSYKCMDYPETTETVSQGPCLKETRAVLNIRCRADWLKSQKTLDYWTCAAEHSTGDFKAYYQNKADSTRAYIKEYGLADD